MQKLFTTILFGVFVSFSALAQITTAAMNGTVSDSNGEGLPGANVVAVHVPTGTQYGASTRVDGRFNLPNLRVGGPYTVTVTFIGYNPQTSENIFLQLGENLRLEFVMIEEASQLEEVVVTAEDNQFNSDRTGASTTIANKQLTELPTISRSASDIYRLTPTSDGNSFAGRNDQYNNFSLDGSIFNNPFGLDAATPGGQTDAQPISLDAIDQIQVAVAPFDVTQSGFTGASINAVTKSGTNEFKGTVFGFFRNDAMTGSKVDGDDIIVPDLRQFQTGFSLGGPIIKNKLFFFANFEMERREDLGSNFIADDGTSNAENVSRVTEQDLIDVRDALQSIGYEPGPYQGYKHNTDNEKGIFKLDWNINSNHTLTATYNFLNASKDKPAHPSALGRRGPDLTTLQFFNSGYTINNKIQSGIFELRSLFGNKFSNKLQVGFTEFKDSRDPLSTPFPVTNINRDGIRYIVAGHEPFSVHNRLKQQVWQASDNFEIYAGKHTITVGGSLEVFLFDNSFNLGVYDFGYKGGTFGPGFDSVQEFVDSVGTGYVSGFAAGAQATFDNNNANNTWALAETNVGQLAFYVQDRIEVNENLTLTLGLRGDVPLYFNTDEKINENIERKGGLLWDGQGNFGPGTYDPFILYYDENGNLVDQDGVTGEPLDDNLPGVIAQPGQFRHDVLPEQKVLWSPRIGFNYDVNANQMTQIRGGIGLFSGRFPFVWIGNQVANPDFFFYNMTRRDFRFPQVWRMNLGIDQKVGEGWTLTTDIIYTKDQNAMMVRNYGLRLPNSNLQGVDNRPIYGAADRAVNTFGGTTNAYVFTNADKGYTFNWTVQASKVWQNGLSASLSYNYLKAEDVSSIEAEISSDAYDRNPAFGHVNQAVLANSLYGNRHRIVGTLNKTFDNYSDKFATVVSLFFEYAEGGRFSYTYSGDINNDGSALNDLIYVPTDAEVDQMTFAAGAATEAEQRAALKAFIAQDDYLSERRGDYAEKYDILSPWYSRWDLRVLQDYKLNDTQKFQLSIDILNVGNLISSKWGVRQFPQNTQPIGVTVDGAGNPTYSFDTTLTDTFGNDFGLLSRWQMQLGLRFVF